MKFSQKNIENWWFWKMPFFWVGHFEFFFFKKKFFFCLIPIKTHQSLLVSKNRSKVWWLPWFAALEVLGQHLCTGLYLKNPLKINFEIIFMIYKKWKKEKNIVSFFLTKMSWFLLIAVNFLKAVVENWKKIFFKGKLGW